MLSIDGYLDIIENVRVGSRCGRVAVDSDNGSHVGSPI